MPMEMTRIILLSALFLLAFMLWNSWEKDYEKKPAYVTAEKKGVAFQPAPSIATTTAQSTAVTSAVTTGTTTIPAGRLVTVRTDVLEVSIDTLGGNIIQTKLLQ